MSSTASPWTSALLRLSQVSGVGAKQLVKIGTTAAGEPPIDPLELLSPAAGEQARATEAWAKSGDYVESQLEEARKLGANIIGICDDAYPPNLRHTTDAPPFLFTIGLLLPFTLRSVAVIGTRNPTSGGEATAGSAARYFSEQACSIISGLALGCDAAAHRAALEVSGHTVAVLAHGLQTIAPVQNRALADKILEGQGALVSQFPFGVKPTRFQYVERDKTQAGLANGVFLAQSSMKGGSLHAARAILKYRRWLAVAAISDADLVERAPSAEANAFMEMAPSAARAEFLRINEAELDRVLLIKGTEDYSALLPHLWQYGKPEYMETFSNGNADFFPQRSDGRRHA